MAHTLGEDAQSCPIHHCWGGPAGGPGDANGVGTYGQARSCDAAAPLRVLWFQSPMWLPGRISFHPLSPHPDFPQKMLNSQSHSTKPKPLSLRRLAGKGAEGTRAWVTIPAPAAPWRGSPRHVSSSPQRTSVSSSVERIVRSSTSRPCYYGGSLSSPTLSAEHTQ